MVITGLIVALYPLAKNLLHHIQRNLTASKRQHGRRSLQDVQRHAGIAARHLRHGEDYFITYGYRLAAQPSFLIR